MSDERSAPQDEERIEDLDVSSEAAESIRGGGTKTVKPDGSLDAGLHFKYDLKAQKEG